MKKTQKTPSIDQAKYDRKANEGAKRNFRENNQVESKYMWGQTRACSVMPQFHKSANCFCGLRCCRFGIVLRCFIWYGEVALSNQKLRAHFFYYCHFFLREKIWRAFGFLLCFVVVVVMTMRVIIKCLKFLLKNFRESLNGPHTEQLSGQVCKVGQFSFNFPLFFITFSSPCSRVPPILSHSRGVQTKREEIVIKVIQKNNFPFLFSPHHTQKKTFSS